MTEGGSLMGEMEWVTLKSGESLPASLVGITVAGLRILLEMARVLVPGGVVALSTHDPTMDWQLQCGSYFDTRTISETWTKAGRPAMVTFWRRPLTAMFAAFHATRFMSKIIW